MLSLPYVFDIKKCKVCIQFYSSKNRVKQANMFKEFLQSFFVDLNEPLPAVYVPKKFTWVITPVRSRTARTC